MSTETTPTQYTIDATNKRLGTIATEAASFLIGKNLSNVSRHLAPAVVVTIENASKIDIPDKKRSEIYQSYSGYPGGRNEETLDHLANRLGYSEVVRRTVKGMLPKNKLQSIRMKNLIVTE